MEEPVVFRAGWFEAPPREALLVVARYFLVRYHGLARHHSQLCLLHSGASNFRDERFVDGILVDVYPRMTSSRWPLKSRTVEVPNQVRLSLTGGRLAGGNPELHYLTSEKLQTLACCNS